MLPFKMKRVFYLYDVPQGSFRGKHAHIEHFTFLIAINGSFDVTLIDTNGNQEVVTLNRPNKGLLIPNMVWHELNNFTSGAVCLVLASDVHKEEDYIRDFDEFLKY
jgi:dTDP-4-dehydrorhamnose 3,5-epimerase-like enzyme